MKKKLTVAAAAKINLWLRVLGRREDGYHEVETRMLRLSLADEVGVVFETDGDSLALTCSDSTVPTDRTNLAARALEAFQQMAGVRGSWTIHLEKKIPAGAGLGGGSANAAAVLRAANELTGHPLKEGELIALAGTIGADVAFFSLDALAADGRGKGELVERVESPGPLSMVLIKPPFPVATPWAYQVWKDSAEIPGVLYAPQITPWGALVNDLERPVFEKYLLLPVLKMWLLEQPECAAALMSGSGSTVFAVARNGARAVELAERVRAYVGPTAWVQVVQAG
jgi:4-diphosphocytidyl-2-C-methyl-D-erythritol kinase